MRKRRKRIEAWPRIKPCVKVGCSVKTYADAMAVGGAEEKGGGAEWRVWGRDDWDERLRLSAALLGFGTRTTGHVDARHDALRGTRA